MEKLGKGLWYSKRGVSLKEYKATSGRAIYFILAESLDEAKEKANDWRQGCQIEEL